VKLGAGQPLGERALRFPLPDGADPPTLLATLRARAGVVDAIVTDAWVAVTFDGEPPDVAGDLEPIPLPPPREHVVRVRYDGPDLDEVAARLGLTPAEVARGHAEGRYRARFIGFAPGFAYLGGLDARLRVPRRASPRTRVPAGAVAIAGDYTAIYPAVSPGGWNLIGSAEDGAPAIAPGDLVRFVAR